VLVNNTSKFHAFYYSNGVLQDIGAMGAPTNFPTQSVAHSINNAGQVVGSSTTPTDENPHAIQWDPVHGFTDLSKTTGAEGIGESINNAGLVVGNYGDAAAIYSGGTHQTLPSGLSTAYDVNNLGALVGSTDTAIINGFPVTTINYGHAFLYQNGQLSSLGTLPGFGGSAATAINDSGIAVGNVFTMDSSANITAQHAVLGNSTGLVDLNTLISANSGWTLNYARDINDVGQIVGLGTLNGQQHAYLLSPTAVPEPSNIALILGMGVTGVTYWRRRKQVHRHK
jgi:probable HAF family extracellular repeat protein